MRFRVAIVSFYCSPASPGVVVTIALLNCELALQLRFIKLNFISPSRPGSSRMENLVGLAVLAQVLSVSP